MSVGMRMRVTQNACVVEILFLLMIWLGITFILIILYDKNVFHEWGFKLFERFAMLSSQVQIHIYVSPKQLRTYKMFPFVAKSAPLAYIVKVSAYKASDFFKYQL